MERRSFLRLLGLAPAAAIEAQAKVEPIRAMQGVDELVIECSAPASPQYKFTIERDADNMIRSVDVGSL